MSVFRWGAPDSLSTALDTALNALADSTSDTTGFSALSSAIDNEGDRKQFIALELNMAAQGVNRSAGAVVEVWIAYAVDPTPNFVADSHADLVSGLLAVFSLDDAGLAARRLALTNIPIPPFQFKLYVRNDTGQAFAASGNTLKLRRYNEEVI